MESIVNDGDATDCLYHLARLDKVEYIRGFAVNVAQLSQEVPVVCSNHEQLQVTSFFLIPATLAVAASPVIFGVCLLREEWKLGASPPA